MSVFALGLNHTTAPLDVRGKLAFSPEQMTPALHGLRERLALVVPEAALVSTCNRTELYVAASADKAHELVRPAIDWLAEQGGISGSQLLSHSYVMEDRLAARHAFRVASGLDSMVLGEPQILGQMARWAPRCTSCSSAASRWPRKCAAPPRSAPTASAWLRPPCAWRHSCSRT